MHSGMPGNSTTEKLLSDIRTGARSDRDLEAALSSLDEDAQWKIVTMLQTMSDSDGLGLLWRVAQNIGFSADCRIAAVHALTKRLGPDVSDFLRQCLHDNDEDLRNPAVMGLAAFGTEVAWEDAWDALRKTLATQNPTLPDALPWKTLVLQSKVLPLVCYLGRHLDNAARRRRVVDLVRENWSRLYTAEQRWFGEYWPACNPSTAERSITDSRQPDSTALADWVRIPFFENDLVG